nr:hypothetical protein [Tanacetum cinerariifolium]
LLRIAANQLAELPAWLLTLPRLSWLAYAGNPFSAAAEAAAVARHPIASIPWAQLRIEQQLGEGASGVIYRAGWHRGAAVATEVAVKLFKGAVTSDGLPHSEMAACISAGAHPNLIAVKGKIAEHPAGAEGLVLELIDPAFRNLGGPPSLASCTRDVYAPGTAYSLRAALRIALGMAAAAAHLHTQGIMHGDLYAHNILYTEAGEALLGDFGAACFFDPADLGRAQALQRLEVRAFACLLEDLLTHCPEAAAAPAVHHAWQQLQHRCAQPDVAARPLFAEIVQELAGWAALRRSPASHGPASGCLRSQESGQSRAADFNRHRHHHSGGGARALQYGRAEYQRRPGGGLLGYAQFPGGAAATDGVAILYSAFGSGGSAVAPYNLGRTATHEVGHWLNLRHIWGDTRCGNDQ